MHEALAREALGHVDALYKLARYLTGRETDAEDLVQETYARAVAGAAGFTPGTNLKAWLFRILRNTFISLYRRRRASPEVSGVDVADAAASQEWLRDERVLAMAPAPRRLLWRRAWAPALAAALVLLVTAPVVFYQRTAATRVATATMVNEAIADHLRIAQAQRPLEIESGDGHRVRPWFEGRLDFSPVLPFVGDREVPLRGGALAWFLDRRAAAFVYGLRLHTVTLFVFRPDGLPWPSTGWQRAGAHDVYRDSARGFTVVMWRAHGLGYALVSDVDPREVLDLAARVGGV